MFIFGWGGNNKILGDVGVNHCDNCKNDSLWQIVESSKRATVYFIPIVKWGRKYFCLCSVCSYGYGLEDRQKAQDLLLAAHQEKEQHKIHVAGHQNVAPDTAEEIGRSQPARKNDPYKGNRDRSGSTHAANNESAAENEKDSPLEIEDDDPLELEDIPIVAEVRENEGNKKEKDNDDEPKEGLAQTGFEKVVLAIVAVSILFLVLVVLVNLSDPESTDKSQAVQRPGPPQQSPDPDDPAPTSPDGQNSPGPKSANPPSPPRTPYRPPASPKETILERAKKYKNRNDYQNAEQCYSLHLAQNPNDYECYLWRGFCFIKQKKYDSAHADLTFLIKHKKRLFQSHKYRGIIWFNEKKYDYAKADFSEALKHNPPSRRELGEAHYFLSRAYVNTGDNALANHHFSLAAENGF